MAFRSIPPVALHRVPAARWTVEESHIMNHHLILAIIRALPLHDITTHRDVELDLEIRNAADTLRDGGLHDRPPINIPEQPPLPVLRLVPGKTIVVPLRPCHVVVLRVHHPVLVMVLAVVVAPVQTGMIHTIAIP